MGSGGSKSASANNVNAEAKRVANAQAAKRQAAINANKTEKSAENVARRAVIEAQQSEAASVQKLNEETENAKKRIMTAQNNVRQSRADAQRTRNAAAKLLKKSESQVNRISNNANRNRGNTLGR